MKLIKENDKAMLWWTEFQSYEIWIKLFRTVGKDKGTLIAPTDEDFGVSCWATRSVFRAERIFDEITSGKRQITPMTEATEY